MALSVRQASLHVWKVVVHNTAKTLREILPSLFTLLLGCLAGTSYDKRQVIFHFSFASKRMINPGFIVSDVRHGKVVANIVFYSCIAIAAFAYY